MLKEVIDEETFEPEIEEGLKRIDKKTDRKLIALYSFFTLGLIGSIVLWARSDDDSPWKAVGGVAAVMFGCGLLTLCDFGRKIDVQEKENYFAQMRNSISELSLRTSEEKRSLVEPLSKA